MIKCDHDGIPLIVQDLVLMPSHLCWAAHLFTGAVRHFYFQDVSPWMSGTSTATQEDIARVTTMVERRVLRDQKMLRRETFDYAI